MNKMLVAMWLLLAVTSLFHSGSSYQFEDCSTGGTVEFLDLIGCDPLTSTEDNCVVSVGSDVELVTRLTLDDEYSDLQLHFTSDGEEFPIPDSDVCNNNDLDCSVLAGETTVLKFKNSVPEESANMENQKFEATLQSPSEDSTPICFRMVLSIA